MEDQTIEEKEYQKGFNEGYLIANHMPKLGEELHKSVTDSSRSEGFKAGYEQFSNEKAKENYPSWLRDKDKDDTNSKTTKSKDRGIDKE